MNLKKLRFISFALTHFCYFCCSVQIKLGINISIKIPIKPCESALSKGTAATIISNVSIRKHERIKEIKNKMNLHFFNVFVSFDSDMRT